MKSYTKTLNETWKVKAITTGYNSENQVICGYLVFKNGKVPCVSINGETDFFEVDENTICRNIGVKHNEQYLYENDLILFERPMMGNYLGVIFLDNHTNSFRIKPNSNYSGTIAIKSVILKKIIGNVSLSDKDLKKWQKDSEKIVKRGD